MILVYALGTIGTTWKTFLGTDDNPFTFIEYRHNPIGGSPIYVPEDEIDDYFPRQGCTPGKIVEIVQLGGGGTTEVLFSTDYQPPLPDPTNLTITTVVTDGDPPLTSLENGDGSIVISDDGNVSMRNDGGTLFLNEFGNAGLYANNDASLTADNQVQLGVGGTTLL